MVKDISTNRSIKDGDSLNLPIFSQNSESTLNQGKIFPVSGTNVLRVPFGVRLPKRKKPQIIERVATLVLPFQTIGSPVPPPNAA